MITVLLVLAGTAFLAVLVFAVFVLLVISIHRTPRVPMSEARGRRAGAFARCVITGVSGESEGDGE
jgi:hypothetical protein